MLKKRSRSTNELIVLPESALHLQAAQLVRKSVKIWNPTNKKQFGVKLQQALAEPDKFTPATTRVRTHFQNGTVSTFLFIPESYSLFAIHEALREAFEETISKSQTVSFNLLGMNGEIKISQEEAIDALASLIHLSCWKPPSFKTYQQPVKKAPRYGFYTDVSMDRVRTIVHQAEAKARATNQVRTLAMMPPNMLGSKDLIDYVMSKSRSMKISRRFINQKTLKEMGAGAFSAVIQTTESAGGILILKRPGNSNEIALVGKGIVYDTGGLDLKTEGSMLGMHRDMTGAALAFSVFEAICKLDRSSSISCYLAIGENLIGEKSYKAGEVIKTLAGPTMEIQNTDAEGRMLLVDTLALANRELKKGAVIIDFATLTGSAADVLSTAYSIAFTNREDMMPLIALAGRKSGERVHPLPVPEEVSDEIWSYSDVADLIQCSPDDAIEHCYAAAILQAFVSPDKIHIHVDISSEHRNEGLGLVGSDVTGFGVRFAIDLIARLTRIRRKKHHGRKRTRRSRS